MSARHACPSCGTAYTDHLGLVGTCLRGEVLAAALREMTDYAGGFEMGLHDDDKERHRKFIARARAVLEGKP